MTKQTQTRISRDRTRGDTAKAATMTRNAKRRGKSARLFLALAFPAELAI